MGIIGAILGDIAGSEWEFSRKRPCDWESVPLFTDKSCFTDDTVMSIATKCAMLWEGGDFAKCYREFGRKYPHAGYGGMFRRWLNDSSMGSYNSFGNGSAMRVSPCGEHAESVKEAGDWARASASCTHNHPEGIKGAMATAEAVWMAENGKGKEEIKKHIETVHGYELSLPLSEIRGKYRWNETCQGSVPESIICFLESTDWESCIRNVLSLRGDTDTMGAIAGAIAESYYNGTGYDSGELMARYLDSWLLDHLIGEY